MVTLAELRAKHQEIIENSNKSGGNNFTSDFANFKNTNNLIRILPGKEDPLDFFVESHLHKYQDAEGKWKNYTCRKSHQEACPMCDLIFDLWGLHRNLNLPKGQRSKYGTLATKIKARPRFYVKAVVRELVGTEDANGNPVDPVKFVAMSEQLFNKVMQAITDEDLQDESDPDNTTIISLERGNDFDYTITKKGDYNNFDDSKAKIKKTKAGTDKQSTLEHA